MDEIGCTNLKYWNVNNEKQTFERYIELAGVRTPRCRGFCFGLWAFAICIWAGRKEAKSSTGNMPLQILSSGYPVRPHGPHPRAQACLK
jgi:hypothetical protein